MSRFFCVFGEIFLYFFCTPIDVVHHMMYNITIKRDKKQGGQNNGNLFQRQNVGVQRMWHKWQQKHLLFLRPTNTVRFSMSLTRCGWLFRVSDMDGKQKGWNNEQTETNPRGSRNNSGRTCKADGHQRPGDTELWARHKATQRSEGDHSKTHRRRSRVPYGGLNRGIEKTG